MAAGTRPVLQLKSGSPAHTRYANSNRNLINIARALKLKQHMLLEVKLAAIEVET
jgi:hypothetical protein